MLLSDILHLHKVVDALSTFSKTNEGEQSG